MKKQPSTFIKIAAPLMFTGFLFACSNNSESITATTNSESVAKAESSSTIENQEIAGEEQMPPRGNQGGMFSDLDDETKEKAQSIMEQERNGSITREEAQKQLAELGVEPPERRAPQE